MANPIIAIIFNFLIVQISILAFMAPFYLYYRYKHVKNDGEKLSHSDHLEKFFLSKESNYLVFFWAMGEALIWFVIPEFLLLLIVFMRIKRKRELLIYDVAGTVAGTVIAFFIHISNNAIAHLPYIQKSMVDQTISWYDQYGILGLIYQPFSGVPYKVFTLTANRYGFFFLAFILFAILVRMSRYLICFGLFIAIYPGLHKFVYKNYIKLFFITTFIFSVLLLKVYNSYGSGHHINMTHPPNIVYQYKT